MEDEKILELILDTDKREEGYLELVGKYKERIYWQTRQMVLSHDDSNDLVQDIFIRIYQNINTFKGDSALSTWIYRIAHNHTLNFLSSKRRKTILSFSSLEDRMIQNLEADPLFDSSKAELILQKAILKLPPRQRAIFNLRYYQEMPFAEIAQIMNRSESAMKSSYHFASKKIEEYVLKDNNKGLD